MIKGIVSKLNAAVLVSSVALFTSASAMAEDVDYAGQAMDSLQTQATDMIGKVWPVVATIVGASLGIRLFKKFSSKAV